MKWGWDVNIRNGEDLLWSFMASRHLNSLLIVKDGSRTRAWKPKTLEQSHQPRTFSLRAFFFFFKQASQAQVDKSDYNMVDHLIKWRAGCLEAYTGIAEELMGNKENVHPDVMLVQPRVEFILSCLDHSELFAPGAHEARSRISRESVLPLRGQQPPVFTGQRWQIAGHETTLRWDLGSVLGCKASLSSSSFSALGSSGFSAILWATQCPLVHSLFAWFSQRRFLKFAIKNPD